VTGSDSGTRYRIWRGRQMNIEELDSDGNPAATWRAASACRIPWVRGLELKGSGYGLPSARRPDTPPTGSDSS
jgi:hypothetical protein